MKQDMGLAEQPLQIQQGKSNVTVVTCPLQEADICAELRKLGLQSAYVVLWQVNAIRWGKWEQGAFAFTDDKSANVNLWLELRIFNAQSELHLVRQGAKLTGRFRTDGEGKDAEYVDSLSRFWGEKKSAKNGWLKLEDADRKLSQTVPQPQQNARFYGLVTRNYLGINEKTAQAGYQDYRYVAIAPADVKGDA